MPVRPKWFALVAGDRPFGSDNMVVAVDFSDNSTESSMPHVAAGTGVRWLRHPDRCRSVRVSVEFGRR